MSPSTTATKTRWEQAQEWLWGAVWTLGPGLSAAAADAIDDILNYEGPVDWRHVGGRFVLAAGTGLAMYLRKQQQEDKALYKLPPDGGRRAERVEAERVEEKVEENRMAAGAGSSSSTGG